MSSKTTSVSDKFGSYEIRGNMPDQQLTDQQLTASQKVWLNRGARLGRMLASFQASQIRILKKNFFIKDEESRYS